jgi:KDO2-lipid IV(A) lauroyltransferase
MTIHHALLVLLQMASKKKSPLQIRVEYAIARSLFGLLAAMPRPWALAVSSLIAKIGFGAFGRLRRTGLRNLEIAFPEMSSDERTRLLRGTFANLGRVLGEVSQFKKATPETLSKIVDFELDEESRELYQRVREEKRGVVITTGHLGNWELLVFAFAALHEPIAYLARPLDNPLIEDLTVRIRTMYGNRPINKTNSAMLAIKLLREGEILGVLADVNAHPKEGVFVPFFGQPSCTSAGPATFAIRTNSLIYPTFCVYEERSRRYKIVHGPVIEPVITGDLRSDIIATTAEYTAEIEKLIRQYPEQWLWIHKRWKTRPKGESPLY